MIVVYYPRAVAADSMACSSFYHTAVMEDDKQIMKA